MKVLIVSNLFPPRVIGGAEVAAYSWARWLVQHGHQVRVLTTAFPDGPEGLEEVEDGILVERRNYGYIYPLGQLRQPPLARRALWHWHDHFGREARRSCAAAIADFQPEMVNCHDLQGLGYNVLNEIAESEVPCVQTLHDFGFLCFNMAMFRNGQECSHHHLACRSSAAIKLSGWAKIRRLSFWSPSKALLERYRPFLPAHAETTAIPYPLYFAHTPAEDRVSGAGPLRLLYVGQVTEIKGVAFVLELLARLAGKYSFHLEVVGGGSELEKLRALYRDADWVHFAGRVAPEQVGSYMAASDLLLTPSLWFENSPLVIYQAISLGLPILASRTGGIPELVEDNLHGRLVSPGDGPAWSEQLEEIFSSPSVVAQWRKNAAARRTRFQVDEVGAEAFELFERTASRQKPSLAIP